jgi:hypothetical protein
MKRRITFCIAILIAFCSCDALTDLFVKVGTPPNLATTIDDQNTITLTWTPVAMADSYSVEYYKNDPLGWTDLGNPLTAATASYTLRSMSGPQTSLNQINGEAKFRVRAKSGSRYSEYSQACSQAINASLADETTQWGTTQTMEYVSPGLYRARYYFKNTGNISISSITCPKGMLSASGSGVVYPDAQQPSGSFSGILKPGEHAVFYSSSIAYSDTPSSSFGVFYSFQTY